MSSNHYFDANRLSWDERVAIHAEDETGFYHVAKVLNGEDKLNAIEAREIGDIAGLRVAHLQCHFGLDSFCLERRGADVVGLDFSSAAIAKAREMGKTMGLKTRFVEGNVYDARKLLAGDFDMVYVTWGAINWLPDIAGWANVVGSLLKPGGHLYLAESHPTTLCLEWVDGKILPHYDWRTPIDKPFAADDAKTYNGSEKELRNRRVYEWIHPLSDILNGLNAAGLSLAWLHEHAALTWALFPNMVEGEDGLYRLPADYPQLPLSFSLKAVKR
ncbi:MAG: class I SAM-dependent methyltransferase [Rhizobiales bacterium]|nr:class I SAM-dependent methyltransferase [Hyphomicrobiales bacterium]